jgi:hypothetical protein
VIATAARRFARGMLAPVPPVVHNKHREPVGCRLLGKCQGWRGNTGQRPGLLEIAAVPQTAPILLVTRRYNFGPLNSAAYSPGVTSATEGPILRASKQTGQKRAFPCRLDGTARCPSGQG